jgi:hypothetical protein
MPNILAQPRPGDSRHRGPQIIQLGVRPCPPLVLRLSCRPRQEVLLASGAVRRPGPVSMTSTASLGLPWEER